MASDFLSIIEPAHRNQQDQGGEPAAGGRVLPVLPVRDTVLFPHAVLPQVLVRKRVHDANSSLNTANLNALLLRAMRNSVERKRQALSAGKVWP